MSERYGRKGKQEEPNPEYLDTGCPEVAPSCLACFLPECRHDNQQAYLSWVLDTRRTQMRADRDDGAKVYDIASKYGVSVRTVHRAMEVTHA
jgi:hypothetical protein